VSKFKFADVDGESAVREAALLLSERSRMMALNAMHTLQRKSKWADIADFSWDEIESAIDEAIFELSENAMPDFTPVGFISAYPSNTPPSSKWLVCNGQTLAQAGYPDLYALIGNFYTIPPITDMFKVPNLQTKILRGSDTGVNTPGTGGGSDTHTLTTAEIPAHDHTIAHTHTIPIADNGGVQARAARGTSTNIGTLSTSASSAANSGSSGGGGAHNNLPAVVHMAYMIKALP